MAADEAIVQRAKRTGMGLIEPLSGLACLHTIMSAVAEPFAAATLVSAVPADWSVLLRGSKGAVPNFFADVAPQLPTVEADTAASATPSKTVTSRRSRRQQATPKRSSRRTAAAAAAAEQQPAVSAEAVQAAVAEVTRSILGTEVAPAQPLMEAGLDSLGAVELRNALSSKFGLELVPTLIFDYPSVAALAGHLASSIAVAPLAEHTLEAAQADSEPESDWSADGRRASRRRARGPRRAARAAAPAAPANGAQLEASIVAQLAGVVESVLGAAVDPQQPLMEAGLDSLGECVGLCYGVVSLSSLICRILTVLPPSLLCPQVPWSCATRSTPSLAWSCRPR